VIRARRRQSLRRDRRGGFHPRGRSRATAPGARPTDSTTCR
jgi:hypothetical protein